MCSRTLSASEINSIHTILKDYHWTKNRICPKLAWCKSVANMNLQSFATSAKVAMANLPSPHLHWVQSFENRASAASEVRTKKTEVRYFTVQTEQARSINCLLYGYSIFPVSAATSLHL